MSGRGRDWALLGGSDPTPGEVGVVDAVATGLQARAWVAAAAVGDLTALGHAVGGSSWQGSSADTFLAAYGPTPTMVAAQGQGYTAAAAALTRWSAALTGLQAEADLLLDAAEANDDRLRAAEAALAGAQAERRAAADALQAARDEEDGDPYAAWVRYDRAVVRVAELTTEIAEAEVEARRLRTRADALHDEHTAAVLAVAAAVRGATPPALDLLPFAVAVTAAAADAALPDVDAAGRDGIISPAELAAMVEHGLSEALQQDLDDDGRQALERLLAAVADDRALSGEVLEALERDGVRFLLVGLHELGRYPQAEALAGFAEGILAVIGAGSATSGGRQVLLEVVRTEHSEFEAVLMASIPGLHHRVVLAIAEEVIGDEDMPHLIAGGGAFFPHIAFSGALVVVLDALAGSPQAVNAFFATDAGGRLQALLGAYPDTGVADAALAVLETALADPSQATGLAAAVIQHIGAHGIDHDRNLELLALLVPHLPAVLVNPSLESTPLNNTEWREFLVSMLEGLQGPEIQVFTDVIVGTSILMAAGVELPSQEGWRLANLLADELGDVLRPLHQALGETSLSQAEAQAALAKGLTRGVEVVNAILTAAAMSPHGAAAKATVGALSSVLAEVVGNEVAAAASPEGLTPPDVQEQATDVVMELLPELVRNDAVRDHLIELGAAEVVPAGAVPSGTPPELAVPLQGGSVVLVSEYTWNELQEALAEALVAG